MTTQSETPRVDALSVVGYGEGGIESSYGFRCVPIEDARQLEREVTAMTAKISEQSMAIELACNVCEMNSKKIADLTAQLAEARSIAWEWGQGVDDAEAAIRKLSRMFPIDAMKEPK